MTGKFDKARLDPATVFDAPEELVASDDLTLEQKIEVLLRWEYDVRELRVAEEEGMTGEVPVTIEQIHSALHALGKFPDYESESPTKQGGI